jgi:hypothetical protein
MALTGTIMGLDRVFVNVKAVQEPQLGLAILISLNLAIRNLALFQLLLDSIGEVGSSLGLLGRAFVLLEWYNQILASVFSCLSFSRSFIPSSSHMADRSRLIIQVLSLT